MGNSKNVLTRMVTCGICLKLYITPIRVLIFCLTTLSLCEIYIYNIYIFKKNKKELLLCDVSYIELFTRKI